MILGYMIYLIYVVCNMQTRFALELHMVHEGKKGRMAVVTVLYKIGRADTFIRSVHTIKT